MVQAADRPVSAGRVAAEGGRGESTTGGDRPRMAAGKRKPVSCESCFFNQHALCALKQSTPCPTYRPADRGLVPERQLAFVFRTDRVRSAYAFPQPG